MATILITGANGKVSSGIIHALQGKGHRLVALVRDAAKGQALAAAGVELRVGDLEKLRTVEDLFHEVDVAWILTPPGPLAPLQSSNALWAARRAGVRHVVRMSAVGAAHDAPTLNSRLHALSDAEVERSGIPYTILKPHFFMQNLMMAARTIVDQGAIYFGLGDARLPMIDARDVSEAAAAVLADPGRHAGRTYSLTSATPVSMDDFAAAVGQATGRKVSYVAVPVAAMVESMAKLGVDDYNQVAMRDYFTAYSAGWQDQPTDSVRELTGKLPRTLSDFARDHAAAFGGR